MIKLVIADIRNIGENIEQLLAQIAPMYAEKYEQKRHDSDKMSELAAGYLLYKYLGVERDEQLSFNEHHKPYLVSGEKYFNLSHSGDYVAMGIADCEIGVDLERIRDYTEAVAVRVFAQDKKDIFATLEGEEKNLFYSKSWTEVEALVKCKGVGFDDGWKGISTAEANLYSIRHGEYYVSVCVADDVVCIADEIVVEVI